VDSRLRGNIRGRGNDPPEADRETGGRKSDTWIPHQVRNDMVGVQE
jgi:hypothetical protein